MSALQIAILGTLVEGACHPYDVKKKLLRFADKSITITDGALYYSFDSLMKKGYIEQTEVVHSDNRPDKTMYTITTEGKQGLQEEIYKMFEKYTDIKALIGTIPFLHLADGQKLASYIKRTIRKLHERMELIEQNRIHLPEIDRREQVEFLADYSEQWMRIEIEWFNKLLSIVQPN